MTAAAGRAAAAVVVWRRVNPMSRSVSTSVPDAATDRTMAIAPRTNVTSVATSANASSADDSTFVAVAIWASWRVQSMTSIGCPAMRSRSASTRGMAGAPPSSNSMALM